MLREVAAEEVGAGHEARRATDSRFQGSLDVVQPSRLAGWAMDQDAPGTAVAVDILLDGTIIGTVEADRLRKDLEKAGIGTGRYGFEIIPARPLAEGDLARLVVLVRAGDGGRGRIPNRAAASSVKPAAGESVGLGELKEIRALLAKLVEQTRPSGEGLQDRLDAVEVVQARLDASLVRIEKLLDQRLGRGGNGLAVAVALLGIVALASLGLGVMDLWNP